MWIPPAAQAWKCSRSHTRAWRPESGTVRVGFRYPSFVQWHFGMREPGGGALPQGSDAMTLCRGARAAGLLAIMLVLGSLDLAPSREPNRATSEANATNTSPHWSQAELETMRVAFQQKHARLLREGPKRFDQPQEAQEFFVRQRRQRGQAELPIDHLRAELTKLERRERALARQRSGRMLTGGVVGWSAIGPGNIGGRTRAIVIDPANPSTMYAGGVTGGIWKSTDAGAGWHATDDLLPNLAISAIAMDPTNPNVLYAGTGEGFFASRAKHRGLGIFKSVDAGATWNLLPGTVDGAAEGALRPTGWIPHRAGLSWPMVCTAGDGSAALQSIRRIRTSPTAPTRLMAYRTSFGKIAAAHSGRRSTVAGQPASRTYRRTGSPCARAMRNNSMLERSWAPLPATMRA